jgi:hypothetical protein
MLRPLRESLVVPIGSAKILSVSQRPALSNAAEGGSQTSNGSGVRDLTVLNM